MTTPWHLEAESPIGRGTSARRYRLANGLGLITARDRSAPIVSLQTWYRVGSRHERPGATGMAHLFEHLMFGQTERLPPGEFDRVVERTGGESNAATWVDWTYYRLSLPARDLPLGVRLESERMRELVLEPGPIEAERDVVTNERRTFQTAAQVAELATEMKGYAKTLAGSVYTVDRRTDAVAAGGEVTPPRPQRTISVIDES